MGSGSDLSSRAVSSQVLSALESLTSVFGMGTGGTSPSLPPEFVNLSSGRSFPAGLACVLFRLALPLHFPLHVSALFSPCLFQHPDNRTAVLNDSFLWPQPFGFLIGSFFLQLVSVALTLS